MYIPKAVQDYAERGLKRRKEHGSGGTKVGETVAKLLAAGGTVTARKARHMARYFPRHAHGNLNQTSRPSRGCIA
ncbi:hypothetical protein [Deinococcus sp. QL22]|uniref:hypothetical protein n=1 Tax=Deinococcus sp. QL22 TaxID=2939437 RepID=UPI0020175E22|nr:hypothetical protein [Deinococcus sp. QL22]UQN08674.1 hypothetical protein M1R55_21355 [Deinococcus sp. QL22]